MDFSVFGFERSQRVEGLKSPFSSPEEELDEVLRVLKEFIFTYFHGTEGNGEAFQVAETEIVAKYVDASTRICPKRTVVNHEKCGNCTQQAGPSQVYEATFVYDFRSRLLNEYLLKRRLLMERKKCSIWGKPDHIYQWMEWTKGGIHTNNYELQNRHFNYSNIPSAINGVGTYLIDALVNQDDPEVHMVSTQSASSIRTLTLFPYRKAEFEGFDVSIVSTDFTGKERRFYVKKTDSPSEGFKLLQMLIEMESGSRVDFDQLSHTRGGACS